MIMIINQAPSRQKEDQSSQKKHHFVQKTF